MQPQYVLFSGFVSGVVWITFYRLGRRVDFGKAADVALFLSTFTNKVDQKGRVSVPASFRAALASESFQGVVLFRSHSHIALEGFGMSYMSEISNRLDNYDLFSDEQDDLATAIFAESVQLPFDGDGRIVLPKALMEDAQISDRASFVGLGHKFQIWSPEAIAQRKKEARNAVAGKKMTLPKGGQAS